MHGRRGADEVVVSERVLIEQGDAGDLAEVLGLALAAEDAPHWPPDAWKSFVETSSDAGERRSVLLVARAAAGEVVGWLAASGMFETGELEYVLVHPSHRGRGIGRQLLESWLRWLRERGGLEALLEVRPSNDAALRLYREAGFAERGRRAGYYQDPREDAVLMWRAL